jgi:hypothetical protein
LLVIGGTFVSGQGETAATKFRQSDLLTVQARH